MLRNDFPSYFSAFYERASDDDLKSVINTDDNLVNVFNTGEKHVEVSDISRSEIPLVFITNHICIVICHTIK